MLLEARISVQSEETEGKGNYYKEREKTEGRETEEEKETSIHGHQSVDVCYFCFHSFSTHILLVVC